MKTASKLAPALLVAIGLAAGPALAKDNGRGHGHYKDQQKAAKHYEKAAKEYRKARAYEDRSVRYHVVEGRRYPVVIRDGRNYYVRDGRRFPVVYTDGRDRRYHPNGGHWDNGRRGPPPWTKGRDYRSYGYDRVVYVPVAEYPRYRLYQPQSGYRWVGDNAGNYMLVSIATGIISDILRRGL